MLAAVVLASRGVLAWSAGEATAPAAATLVPGVEPADAFAAAVGVPSLAPAVAPSDLFAKAQALAREAEEKSKALAEAEAAEEEMAKRASTVRTQESEARLLATQKKDEAKDDLNVAQQAERQAATAVQEAEQLMRAATSNSAVKSLAYQNAGGGPPASGGPAFASSTPPSTGFRAVPTSSSDAANFHDMTFKAAVPQGFAPQPAVTQPLSAQPVAPQPVGVQPLAAPTIGTLPPPAVTGQVQTSLTAAQTRKFNAQVEAATAKADLAKAFQLSKAAHRSEASALAHASAPGLDAAQKQAATAELAMARSKHAEAASVVQAAKARAAKAYEEVILSEETEGANVVDATRTRAATVYEGAIAQAAQVAHYGTTGVETALQRTEVVPAPAPAVGGRQQIANIMPAMSSTPFETKHTKVARERVDKALAAATSKEEEVKRIEAWSAALIEAAQQKAKEAMRLAREDVMKADDEAATRLVNFVKAKEREAATVAEEALVKQAEAAKMAQEAANARDEANKAAHKAAQWKADAQQAIKTTKEANLRTEHRPEPNMVTALATAQGSHGVGRAEAPVPSGSKKGRKAKAAAAAKVMKAAAAVTTASPTGKSDATAKPKRAADAKVGSKKAQAKPKKAAALASEDTKAWTAPADVKRDIVHRAWAADGRAADGAAAAVGPAPTAAPRKAADRTRAKAHKAWVASHEDTPTATAAPAMVEDTTPPAETMPEIVPHSGPAGHRVRLAWRAMRDTVMALNDARGVGQPGLEDAYTKQNAALLVLTKVFPAMDDLPTVRSPDLHTLFSQSKELGALILVEEAKTLSGAALKELREQKTATGAEQMTRLEEMQKGVHDSLVKAESSARQRVEAAARKIAAGKQAVKVAVQAEALKKVALAEEKDKAVLGQLRTDVRKKASNAVTLKVRAIQAERVAEADKQEMEAATQAARFAQEEAEVESAKALLDEAAAAANRRREEQRKERRQDHEEDDLAGLAARMSQDAAAYAAAHKQAPVTATVAPRPTAAAARKDGAGEKRAQRGATGASGADAPPAAAAGGKKAAPGAGRQAGQQASGVAKKGAATKLGGVSAGKLAGVAAGKQTFAARRRQQLVALEAPKGAKRERKQAAAQLSEADESTRPQKANRARE